MGSFEKQARLFGSILAKVSIVGMGTALAVVLVVTLGATSSDVWTRRGPKVWNGSRLASFQSFEETSDRRANVTEGPRLKGEPSKGPYLRNENLKVLLRNTEPKTGTTALEWTFLALFREACAEFWRSNQGSSGNCSVHQDKDQRMYSMELNGSKITFSALHKHFLEFQGFVYPMRAVVSLTKACMDVGLSGWSESCAGFAKSRIPDFHPVPGEQSLYLNIYRDPIAATTSWVNYRSEQELSKQELNRRVLEDCAAVAARIGLRARIAWKILPSKGYPVYSYAYESMVEEQEKWAADLLHVVGLHMSGESVQKALDSVSPASMKHVLEDAKKGLVTDLPAGLELTGVNSRKVGTATARGYSSDLSTETLASCRRASLKHLPLAMALKYQVG